MSFYSLGHSGRKFTFLHNLKLIWHIIKYGTPYSDSITLNNFQVGRLKEYLNNLKLKNLRGEFDVSKN